MPKQSNNGIATRIAWNFTRVNDALTEILIYDAIADNQSTDWWTGEQRNEMTPKLFAEALNGVTTPEICIRINSGGGDVFAAEAIRTQIRDKRAAGKKITCKIDGLCASAAVGIAAACETIAIPSSAWFMIHDPACFAYGYFSASEFEKGKTMLDKVKQGIINAYSEKTGKDKQVISDLMTKETWLTGDEAVENGFCDEVMFQENGTSAAPADASVLNIAMYRHCPTALLNSRLHHGGGFANIQDHTQNEEGEQIMDIKTVDDLKAAYPELVAQVESTAAAAERKRIQDIEDIAIPGFEGVINKAKFEAPQSAAEVALSIVAAQKQQGAAYLADADADVKNSGMNGVTASQHEGADDETDPYGAAVDKLFPRKQ